jgi:acetyl-CoA carboxylase biotin carboxyl carrier protein
MSLTYKEVAEILKIIDASECDEVNIELEGVRLSVRRNTSGTAAPAAGKPAPPPPPKIESAVTPVAAAPAVQLADGAQIRSPMVGTFCRRPSPDEAAFVEVGSTVAEGDPLCLIEVMKLFTTIEAKQAGTVKQIAVEDAQLVEFDQVLFVLDPA